MSQTDLQALEVPESLREFNLVIKVLEEISALETPPLLKYDPNADTADPTAHGKGVTLARILPPPEPRTSSAKRGRALKEDLKAAMETHHRNMNARYA